MEIIIRTYFPYGLSQRLSNMPMESASVDVSFKA